MVESLYRLKNNRLYQESLDSPLGLSKRNENSVLMSYDFHLSPDGVKLIEVNTNSAGFLLVNSFYQFQGLDYQSSLESLKDSFKKEWKAFERQNTIPKVVLIDENPLQQKMFLEFILFKDFFLSMGWGLEILDSKDLLNKNKKLYTAGGQKIDFVYNRLTDFYFKNHPILAQAYQEETVLISPQPKDYWLLADKNRLLDWPDWPDLQPIKKHLLEVKALTKNNQDELWSQRKKYFFKITCGYGGKMAYRGSSLTRKKQKELLQQKSIAQEYIPPSTVKDSNGEEWKVDLRAYVYKDQIQQLTARVYQGQLTQFKKAGSGFALIDLKN